MSNYPEGLNAHNFDAAYSYGTNGRTSQAAEDLENALDNFITWMNADAVGPLQKGESTFIGWTLEEINSDHVYDEIVHPVIMSLSLDDGDTPDELHTIWDEAQSQISASIMNAHTRLPSDTVLGRKAKLDALDGAAV